MCARGSPAGRRSMARFDGEYVQNLSFAFDCKCFFGTIRSVLKSEGVVEGGTGQLEKEKKGK